MPVTRKQVSGTEGFPDLVEALKDPLANAVYHYRSAQKSEASARRQLERAQQHMAEARETARQQRLALAEAIVAAARKGRANAEIRRITGYTRERIRQICRGAGVEPAE